METLKILEKRENLNWEYDDKADVLYISIGEPKPAEGFDIGGGIIARVHPETKELVGLTIMGLSEKILREIKILSDVSGHLEIDKQSLIQSLFGKRK